MKAQNTDLKFRFGGFKMQLAVIFLILCISFTACRKEEEKKFEDDRFYTLVGIPSCNATVENGILDFESREDLVVYQKVRRK